MNKIYHAKLNKKLLQSIDKTERAMFFALAHFLNELNALNKLMFYTSVNPSTNRAETLGRLTYQFMLIKYFIGKLNEGNSLISKSFYKSSLSKIYMENLNDEAISALDHIKKYFSKNNIIHRVRNSLAFHYDHQKIDDGFANAPDDLDVFIEKKGNSNNLFYFSEVVAGRALLKESGNLDDNNENPYENLIKEIFEVGRWFSIAINHILLHFIDRHKNSIWDGISTEVDFKKLESVLDVHIPWFVDISLAEEKYGEKQ